MKQFLFIAFIFVHLINWSQAFNGFTLYNQSNQNTTYLIDADGNTAKTWSCNTACNYTVLLKKNGNIIRGGVYNGNKLNGAAVGGMVQEYDANNNVVWEFTYSNENHVSHHDIAINSLNNSVFLIAWEVVSSADLTQAGYNNATDEKWAPHIIEVQPDGAGGGKIIWEWHIMDHLIQDVDASKNKYGVIANHPELIDINQIPATGGGPGGSSSDWFHVNGIDYNPTLDQLVFSSRKSSEIYIIDHSTTTAEAASHTGGNSGKGGDILYRWGNPSNYGASGSQAVTAAVHDPRWIPEGRPYAGYIQLFNNSGNNNQSAVDLINPPVIGYTYSLTAGSAYGPSMYNKRHNCLTNSSGQSASDRMSNGNIFVAVSKGYMYEVDSSGNTVWQYNAGPQKAFRYECDYMGIQNLLGNPCGLGTDENHVNTISIYPNPTSGIVNITGILSDSYKINIYSLQGDKVYVPNSKKPIDLSFLENGIYLINIIDSKGNSAVKKIALTN